MDPTAAIQALREVFQDFSAGLFIGFATICFLVIQVLRGKAGFEIPFVTKWLEKLNKEIKTTIILVLFGIAGALASLGADEVTVWTVIDGVLAGLATGFTTIGVRNTAKQSYEGVKKLKEKMKNGSQG